jgi:hypothetical protein
MIFECTIYDHIASILGILAGAGVVTAMWAGVIYLVKLLIDEMRDK